MRSVRLCVLALINYKQRGLPSCFPHSLGSNQILKYVGHALASLTLNPGPLKINATALIWGLHHICNQTTQLLRRPGPSNYLVCTLDKHVNLDTHK